MRPGAFIGGLVVLESKPYFVLTGSLLIIAASLTVTTRNAGDPESDRPSIWLISIGGAGAGFLSGASGVGGGVFLAPLLIILGWASPQRATYMSAPFILFNSLLGFAGVWIAGQVPAPNTALYAAGALAGSIIGSVIGLRWMSDRTTRYVLAAILLFAGLRLLFR
jgi:uncharacterized membrane protein YfcA